jgi:hypothetical protein
MENKVNTGVIFKNDRKTSDKQPDYKGKVNVNGKEMEVALWVKKSNGGGNTFFSAAFSEPYVAPETMERVPVSNDVDDLPF